MVRIIRSQEGMTTLELLMITPFVLFFLFALFSMGMVFSVKNITPSAAREAARMAAATGDYGSYSEPWQKASDIISSSLPTEWSVGTHDGISKAFDPTADIQLVKESGYYTAKVSYHIVTPAPGMAKLLDPSADIMNRYITITSRAYFPDEGS